MSCPAWPALLEARESRRDDPPGFAEALSHLDGCPSCRRLALRLDPLLAFRRLPAPAVNAAEVDAVRQAVAALRGASRMPADGERPARRLPRWPGVGAWVRAAAAAALVALGLFVAPGAPVREAPAGRPAALPAARVEEPLAPSSFVEDLDLAGARVYHVDAQEMQVVMIVHPSLEL